MLVCYLTDEPGKIPAIRAALEPRYPVVPRVLGQEPIFAPSGVLMVDADLREATRVEQIKHALSDLNAISEKLFVVQQHLRHMAAQAFALGATGVVHSPKQAASKLRQVEAAMRCGDRFRKRADMDGRLRKGLCRVVLSDRIWQSDPPC